MATTNIIKSKIKMRHDTEANWKASNPILLDGEVAYSTDVNNQYKVGNGTSTWTALSYAKAAPLTHSHNNEVIISDNCSLKYSNDAVSFVFK